MSGTFPPTGQTSLAQILNAYVYKQYSDDENIQALNSAFNGIAQNYYSFLLNLNLPVYTGLSGSILDWVAEGLYGISRPALQSGTITGRGTPNTFMPNTMMPNSFITTGAINVFTVNDDIFKRIITWFFFKGDGMNFSIPWLKRRIMRFLVGTSGTAPNIDNTYPVSVAFGESNTILITVKVTTGGAFSLATAQIFQAAVASSALALPFQFSFSVAVMNAQTGLENNGGVLQVINTTGWSTTATGLSAGAVWNAGGAAYVVPGVTPNPMAPKVFFGLITSAQLLALGGGNLPTTDPANVLQLWNNSGIICVSLG